MQQPKELKKLKLNISLLENYGFAFGLNLADKVPMPLRLFFTRQILSREAKFYFVS